MVARSESSNREDIGRKIRNIVPILDSCVMVATSIFSTLEDLVPEKQVHFNLEDAISPKISVVAVVSTLDRVPSRVAPLLVSTYRLLPNVVALL